MANSRQQYKKEVDIRPVRSPIYPSTTFERNPDGSYNGDLIYSRISNPNRSVLEQEVASLENGAHGFAFASGMASINAVLQCLKSGDHILLPDDVFYSTLCLVKEIFVPWGLEYSLVDMSSLDDVSAGIKPNTALIWIESPSNPQLKLTDIEKVVNLVSDRSILVAVDNTWATPVLQLPISLGADLVMHSTTKYFGGHGDIMGGCIVLKEGCRLSEKLQRVQMLAGAVPAPMDCWMISRGIQTLKVRVQQQTRNAGLLAEFLEEHPKIDHVMYPGLASHPQHDLAKRQMPNGFGAMLSVLVNGNEREAMQVANGLTHFTMATSLGGTESLIEHRKSVEGPDSPTPESLLRISVGLEDIELLKADWDRAL